MGHCTKSLVILLGLNLLCCDASVTVSLINSAMGLDLLECSSDVVINCIINPYADLINWVINGTRFATCAPICSENPSFNRTYSHTYDAANGEFNLTVGNVTFNDNSTTFKCDDGSSSDDITIKVVPAYSENKTHVNDTDEGKKVEFTTACVQPGVEFYWFTVKIDNSYRETYNEGQNEMTNTTVCSFDSDCGGVGTGKVSSVIMIPTVSNILLEEERYLEVVVKYKNPDAERSFRFNEKFQFEDPNSSTPNTNVSVPQSITLHSTPSSDKTTSVILENGSEDGFNIVYYVIGGFFLILPVSAKVIFEIYKCHNPKRPSTSANTEL